MNVDEMEGRELDVLVAEAMGWTSLGGSETITLYAGHQVSRVFGKVGLPPGRSAATWAASAGAGMRIVPHFSTDVAAVLPAAVQVVGTGHIKIKLMPPDERNERYCAEVALWLGYSSSVRALAEATTGEGAIALALARAVVTAKGVETAP